MKTHIYCLFLSQCFCLSQISTRKQYSEFTRKRFLRFGALAVSVSISISVLNSIGKLHLHHPNSPLTSVFCLFVCLFVCFDTFSSRKSEALVSLQCLYSILNNVLNTGRPTISLNSSLAPKTQGNKTKHVIHSFVNLDLIYYFLPLSPLLKVITKVQNYPL